MRIALVAAALAACSSSSPPAPSQVYITIDTDALPTVAQVEHHAVDAVDRAGEVAVVAIDPADVDALSEAMHEQHQRCGGFMVHDSLDDARAALREPADKRIDYTIDRGELVGAVLPKLDQSKILATIGELSAMRNRYYRSQTGAAASLWLRDRWLSFTDRKDVTAELVDHGYPQKSVVLTIPGTTRASEVIVLGGHLDSIAVGGTESNAPGADDDASGIATLTEVVRVLLQSDYHPARTIKVMAYAAEEIGLRGSLSIARDYKKKNVDVVGALQLDMTNYQGSEKDIYLMQDFTSAAQNGFLAKLIDTYVGASWDLDACGYACSDHAAWHRIGVPASMPFEARMRDANRKIHTANDTLELSNNNASHALKFAKLATAYAVELGKGQLGTPPAPHRNTGWLFGAGAALLLLIGRAFMMRRR